MQRPLVTVMIQSIMPEKTLRRCLDSIHGRAGKSWRSFLSMMEAQMGAERFAGITVKKIRDFI